MLNYTTKVPAHQSIAEISKMLAKSGASAVMHEYDDAGNIKSLSFKMKFDGQDIGFRLPANWQNIQIILVEMRRKNTKIPTFVVTDEHSLNVAWRVIKDWVEAQLALIEANQAKTEQVFLPYAVTRNGQTLYEHIATNPQLLLGDGTVRGGDV